MAAGIADIGKDSISIACARGVAIGIARAAVTRHLHAMLNLVSILIGIFALPFIVIGSIPLLGVTLWFLIILPIVGAAVGALSSRNTGRNFNLVLVVLTAIRISLGGGLI